MAAPNPRQPSYTGVESFNQRRSPLSINTSNAGALAQTRANRFSYIETPVEMQEPQIHGIQFLPDSSPIQESPVYALMHEEQSPQYQQYQYGNIGQSVRSHVPPSEYQKSHWGEEEAQRRPMATSPYNVPEPQRVHPAYYAPIASPSQLSHQFQQPSLPPPSHSPPPLPLQQSSDSKMHRVSTLRPESDEKRGQDLYPPMRSPTIPTSTSPRPYQQPIFDPSSLAGPNGAAPDLHRPGQVAHPNMATFSGTKSKWIHGLCECSGDVGTCMTGVFCPCILDSKTAYRLERKSGKKDPTDLLGFSNCNGRCSIMSVFGLCGLWCFFPLTLRTRIRHVYKLQGNLGSDIVHACCCCCCTTIQNEREVAERENQLRVNEGPAQTQTPYPAGGGNGMVYVPGGA